MKRVLLTGMSGTGKSSLIHRLTAAGYTAVDADEPDWSEYRVVPKQPGEASDKAELVWREDAIRELLSREGDEVLFLAGCASNQGQFYDQFDHIVLLSAPAPVLIKRISNRTNNLYGKRPEELAEILHNLRVVEPLLRNSATLELDAAMPLDHLLAEIIALVDSAR